MIKFYKTPTNEVMVIEQGQEFLVQVDWAEMTDDEIELFNNPPKTQEQLDAEVLGLTEHQWKLHNNTIEVVILDELKEALTLAMKKSVRSRCRNV